MIKVSYCCNTLLVGNVQVGMSFMVKQQLPASGMVGYGRV